MENVTYGLGGWKPDQPGENIVERVVDNGDGTGTRTTYDDQGNVVDEVALTDLPTPSADPVISLTTLTAALAAQAAARDAAIAAGTLTLARLRDAIRSGDNALTTYLTDNA